MTNLPPTIPGSNTMLCGGTGSGKTHLAQTLARLRGQRTLVVIAHQLSTVAMADQIVVLEAGRVVEQGAPAELQAAGGRYAQFLRQRQTSKGWRIAPAAQRKVP